MSAIDNDPQTLLVARLATCSRILIDGDQGAGKTGLAKVLSRKTGAEVVSIDDYLVPNGEVYWNQVDLESLRRKMSTSSSVILEGVCALKVIQKVGFRHDYLIFMKQCDGFMGWRYEAYLSGKGRPPTSKLTSEILLYYKECRPFDVCDSLFVNGSLEVP